MVARRRLPHSRPHRSERDRPPYASSRRKGVPPNEQDGPSASLVSHGALPAPTDWHRWQWATHMLRGLFPVTSSIWVIVAPGSRPLVPTTAAPLSVSTREVVRILPRLGYRVVRGQGKGSHEKWAPVTGTGKTVAIPLNRDIPQGTLNSIAKDLGFVNGHQLALVCRTKGAM